MFGRATITLDIGPHSSLSSYAVVERRPRGADSTAAGVEHALPTRPRTIAAESSAAHSARRDAPASASASSSTSST